MDQTEQLHGLMPMCATLGMRVLRMEPAGIEMEMDWTPERCTTNGLLHGGALMALADSAGGACAFTNLPEGATGTSTIESKTNFFAAVRSGHVEGVSHPLHVGRRTIVVQTDVRDATGRRVAQVTQTQAVLTD